MRTANTHRNMARCAATATLACVLGLGLVAPAYADTASDLAAARTKLEQIGTQTQQIHEELSAQTQELDQTAGEITQKQQEIAEGQAKLSSYVAGEYKTGGLSLLQVLTGVDDLGDMLNRLFYYGKVSDKQAQTIQEVKDLKQQLTDKQTEQEKNVAATQKKVDELRELAENTSESAVAVSIDAEVAQLENKSRELLKKVYADLTPWQMSLVARHPNRPYTLDYIDMMFTDFQELHGDRAFADDEAIVGGLARLADMNVIVIGNPVSYTHLTLPTKA